MGHTLVRADDASVESFRGRFFKIRKALGTTAVGINEIRFPAGAEGIDHDEVETGHEEIYIVTEGAGHFVVDGERIDVRAGDYLRVAPQARRIAHAGDDGMRLTVVAARPQPAYDGRAVL